MRRKTKAETTPKEPAKVVEPEQAKAATGAVISLSQAYSKKQTWLKFRQWIVGDSPLICHAWSEKAKREMLSKMVKAVKHTKEERNPQEEFTSSLYQFGKDRYGFPVTAIKKAILSVAHKDRGIPKTTVMAALWLDFKIVQQRPALAGAICDMPIVEIFGGKPQMREDMVRIKGRGGSIANFAYRAQFEPWAMLLSGKFDPEQIPTDVLGWLINNGGSATGIGDWRNEKSGVFGSFHVAEPEEEKAWDLYVSGRGPMPASRSFAQAAE